jgi:MFS family permease
MSDTISSTHVGRLLAARALRSFADGYVSLLLPIYLLQLGYDALQVGLIATTTLLGSGATTLAVGRIAHRYASRTLLIGAAALMIVTGLGFASVTDLAPLLVFALVGTLNPSSGDVSVFVPLEHAALAHAAGDHRRTAVFARYSLIGALAGACGALAASLPSLLSAPLGVSERAALQAMFVLYALLASIAAWIYAGLPRSTAAERRERAQPLGPSRRHVVLLAALFSVDAFAGGLIVQSMLALWLYERFDLPVTLAGTLFFWTGVLTAFSYLAAARIAKRFGLVNTMVFTHLPSSVCLIAIPFMPSLAWAIALLLVRAALSQMDVPTRSSYVMAIVTPEERPAAASLTSVPRSLAAAIGPVLSGYLLGLSAFGWPLVLGGAIKIAYDIALLLTFRHVRPPEESG